MSGDEDSKINRITSKIKKVLVLYVGGTIGMIKNENGVYVPAPNQFLTKLKFHSQMHDAKLATKYFGTIKPNELVLPSVGNTIVHYIVEEYQPLLDSSNMSIKDWIQIAKDIEKNYEDFTGFVILHGTDTLAYTSSALSFMLENIQKPVILTGSQIPIFETRSDAKDNILASVILAGCYDIPEVCIFFGTKLFRGNRTAKTSSTLLDAFDSPNYHHLADAGIQITLQKNFISKPLKRVFRAYTQLNANVGLLCFFPTITPAIIKALLQPPIEGVVIQSYGSGNIPMINQKMLQVFKDAVERGVVLVNVTQCAQGTVSASYEGGKALEDIGVISGFDMTVEAALTKLCFILGQPDLTYKEKISMVKRNIRGELTNE